MVIEVNRAQFVGLKQLDQALEALADEKGEKWKRAAMVDAGKRSFTRALVKSRTLAPTDTGLLRRSLIIPRPKYRYPSRAQIRAANRNAVIRKNWRHELTVAISLPSSWQGTRYPFIVESGINKRKVHIRTQAFGKPTKDYAVETKRREPVLYMHRALGITKNQIVNIFKRRLSRNIDVLAKTNYKSARTAIRRGR